MVNKLVIQVNLHHENILYLPITYNHIINSDLLNVLLLWFDCTSVVVQLIHVFTM